MGCIDPDSFAWRLLSDDSLCLACEANVVFGRLGCDRVKPDVEAACSEASSRESAPPHPCDLYDVDVLVPLDGARWLSEDILSADVWLRGRSQHGTCRKTHSTHSDLTACSTHSGRRWSASSPSQVSRALQFKSKHGAPFLSRGTRDAGSACNRRPVPWPAVSMRRYVGHTGRMALEAWIDQGGAKSPRKSYHLAALDQVGALRSNGTYLLAVQEVFGVSRRLSRFKS